MLTDFFENNEKKSDFCLTGHFLLVDENKFWFIKKGSVDLFTVYFENNEISGSRSKVFRIYENNCIFGFKTDDVFQNRRTILAVPSLDAEIIEIKRSTINKSIQIKNFIESWTKKLSERFSQETVPEISYENFWEDLDKFHNVVLQLLNQEIQKHLEDEKKRIGERLKNDINIEEQTVYEFASILNRKIRKKEVATIKDAPLFSACSLICENLGIQIEHNLKKFSSNDPLLDIARYFKVRTRRVLLRDKWLKKDIGPVLAFRQDNNQPVAIIPAGDKKYELVDIVNKTRKIITNEISNSLRPEAVMFYRSLSDKPNNAIDLLRFGIHGCKTDFVTIVIMGVLGGILAMFTPFATSLIFDSVIPGTEYGQLFQIIAALIVVAVGSSLFQITRSFAQVRLETKIDFAIQAAVFDRLLKLPVPFFKRFNVGDLVSRLLSISTMREILSGLALSSIFSNLFSVFSFIMMLYYSVKLSLVALVFIIIAGLITAVCGFIKTRYERELISLQGKLSGLVLQFLNGISKLKIAGAEIRAYSIWAKEFAKQRKISIKVTTIENIISVFNSGFMLFATMSIFSFVAFYLKEGGTQIFSTGSFLAFYAAFGQLFSSTQSLISNFISIINIVPLYERAKPIIETVPEVDASKIDPGKLTGEIEVNHIYFKYQDIGGYVLRDISFKAKPGEFIALVGASGSGKSTLLRLLLKFEKPSSGAIYFDKKNIEDIDLLLLRRQLGVVLQNGRIIAGSIFDNIRGALNIKIDEVWEAAKMACFDNDIKLMPMGMHTVIPEGGVTLSGGQRQRLLIARALVHKPKIIFFDEATSALDNKAQAIVSESLNRLKATRIVIAHRLSTVISADCIYVMNKGEIVEQGRYEELIIKPNSLFSELAKRQIS